MRRNPFETVASNKEDSNIRKNNQIGNFDKGTVNYMLNKMNTQSNLRMARDAAKNLMEDPTIYDYDSFYDQINEKRSEITNQKKQKTEQPKYMTDIIKATEKRKREISIAQEKIAEKTIFRENSQFKDKEKFVTSSYLKLLEENKKFEIEDKQKEEYNKQHVAIGRSDLSDFMKNLYNENNSGAGFRPDLTDLIKKDVLQLRNKQKSRSRSRSKSNEQKQKVNESSQVLFHQDFQLVDTINNQSCDKQKNEIFQKDFSQLQEEPQIETFIQQQQEILLQQQPEKINKDDKIQSARDRYLSRKQQQKQDDI